MCIHRYIAVAWAFWIAASNQKWIAKSRYVLYGYAFSTLQGYIFASSQLSVVSRQSEPKIFTSKKASHYLLGGCIPTPLKNMSSSIGMIRNPIYGKIKNGNQTTNQLFTYEKHVMFQFANCNSFRRRGSQTLAMDPQMFGNPLAIEHM